MKKPKSCKKCKFAEIEIDELFSKNPQRPEMTCEKITCTLMNKRCDMFVLEGHGIRPDCPVKWDEVKE